MTASDEPGVVRVGRYKINLSRVEHVWRKSDEEVWVYFEGSGHGGLLLTGASARAFLPLWEAWPHPWREGPDGASRVHGFGHVYDPAVFRSQPNTIANKRADETSFQLARHGHHLDHWYRRGSTWIGQCRDCDHRSYVSSRSNRANGTGSRARCPQPGEAAFDYREVEGVEA